MAEDTQRDARPELAPWLAGLRPRLHRYCARMTGSVIDGEDAVQETLLRAVESFPGFDALDDASAWLFRVAHNAAMDVLRARARRAATTMEDDMEQIPDPQASSESRWVAEVALRSFMQLAPLQRSCVILMDVLGYSLQELCGITGRSMLAVKAALHRGRKRLRDAAGQPDHTPAPILSDTERRLLAAYADRFNARDFDAVRDMLADEVRLDLVDRTRLSGKAQVSQYLHNYAGTKDWLLRPGWVEDRAALLVFEPGHEDEAPRYFVLLEWHGGKLAEIRDFRYARYVMADASVQALAEGDGTGGQHPMTASP